MVRVVAVDMDDTLYDERTFVISGFRAVAREAVERFGLPSEEAALNFMVDRLDRDGRGAIFDSLLAEANALTKKNVGYLVRAYRDHEPSIALPDASRDFLTALRDEGFDLYVVTDGNARVQERKARALGLADYVDFVYATHRYGRSSAKPSPRVFERIAERSEVAPSEIVYVGDDPTKDFVGVRAFGGFTIRVLTGRLAEKLPAPGFEAHFDVAALPDAMPIIKSL